MSIAFDLNEIVNGSDRQTNFTTTLLKLIFKADRNNREKLRQSFPEAVRIVEHYLNTGNIIDLESDV